jgi:TRAP-type C4-dicarboxylate transport system permease small subunit
MYARLGLAYERLLTGCGFVVGLALVALAVLITLDVLLRNLGLFSSGALLEITEYTLFVTTFMAAPWVLRLGSHVRVDLLLTHMPPPVARLMEIAADAAGLVSAVLLGWHGFRVTLVSFERGHLIVKQLTVPEWMLMIVIPVSCLLLAIEFLRRIAVAWRTPPGARSVGHQQEGL